MYLCTKKNLVHRAAVVYVKVHFLILNKIKLFEIKV